jgi:hypothetical protein
MEVLVGAGCFWTVQGIFDHTHGLSNTVAGYVWTDIDGILVEAIDALAPLGERIEVVRAQWDPGLLPARTFARMLDILQEGYRTQPGPPAYQPVVVAPAPWDEVLKSEVEEHRGICWGQGAAFLPAADPDQHRAVTLPHDGYIREQTHPKLWRMMALFPAYISPGFQHGAEA